MTETAGLELKLSGSSLTGLMEAVLARGASFRFQARGHSMAPFIRDGDILTVAPVAADGGRIGAVAAIVNPARGSLIVHRIVDRTGQSGAEADFVIKGDNCRQADGAFAADSLAGLVTRVERRQKKAWYGGGPEKTFIAFLSRTGLLNTLILPVLRKTKNTLFKPTPSHSKNT